MQEVYLYQTVHILGGRSLHLPAHLAVLDRWSRELFGRPAGLRQQPLARQIEALAAQTAPADCDLSQFVRIVVPASGDPAFRLESAGISLYRGYDLRSLMPDAVTLQYDMPFPEAPTSARESRRRTGPPAGPSARRIGRRALRRRRHRPHGRQRPAVRRAGQTAFVSPAEACVEQELGLRAVEAAGLELEERPVMRDELPRFDELFYVDHRGVTALAHCDGHPCMAILAERVAQSLGGLFPKM
ncbi:MAG: branched-chain amino acid aminotransferase [Alistipes sp.]